MKSSGKLLALLPMLLVCPLFRLGAAPEKKGPKYDPGIEVGQDARGLRFPVFNEAGVLQMYFVIDVAKRIDIDHMEMSKVQLQTFNENKEQEMKIDMQKAILDLNTRVVTTDEHVLIRRADFELSGDRALYNTATGDGKVSGNVRMLIFDREAALSGKAGS
jgi:hypothetical protein